MQAAQIDQDALLAGQSPGAASRPPRHRHLFQIPARLSGDCNQPARLPAAALGHKRRSKGAPGSSKAPKLRTAAGATWDQGARQRRCARILERSPLPAPGWAPATRHRRRSSRCRARVLLLRHPTASTRSPSHLPVGNSRSPLCCRSKAPELVPLSTAARSQLQPWDRQTAFGDAPLSLGVPQSKVGITTNSRTASPSKNEQQKEERFPADPAAKPLCVPREHSPPPCP